jgi:hypothetical protein
LPPRGIGRSIEDNLSDTGTPKEAGLQRRRKRVNQPPAAARRARDTWAPVTAHPVISAVITVLIIASIFFAVYVPVYASTTPKVGDFPFFYFYLLVYMPVVSIALLIVIQLQKRLRPPAGLGDSGPADQDEVAR